MAQNNWEAEKMLDVYIYNYLVKRSFNATAEAFQAEAKVSADPVAIDAPGGFLFEWWSVFWDIFIARTNEKHSDVAASYIETQLIKAHEQQQKEQQNLPLQPQQQQHVQMQQLLLQRRTHQQQHSDGVHLLNASTNGLAVCDPLLRHPGTASTLTTRIYEERLKMPVQRDSLDEASLKQRIGESVDPVLDPNPSSTFKSVATSDQPSGSLQPVMSRNLHNPTVADIKSEMDAMLTSRAPSLDGSLVRVPGSSQGGNNLTLKGWPLTGLEQLRSGILQQQKSYIQSPQPLHQLQFLTPQQQQLLLQANLLSPSAADVDNRRIRMLMNNRNMLLGKDVQVNSLGDVIPSVGSPMQTACPILPRSDTDVLIKKIAQMHQQQQQNSSQQQILQPHVTLSQQPQHSNQLLHQQEKMGASSITLDGSVSNSFRRTDQIPNGRKRKQTVSSSGQANSPCTANNAGPSLCSAPSTPSSHTPGDMISMSSFQHNASSKKSLVVFGSDCPGNISAPSNQLGDIDRLGDDGSLDDNVGSFLSQDDSDPRDAVVCGAEVSKAEFMFTEIRSARASTSKVVCCHFSSDGKLFASGGHDKKAVLWHTENLKPKATLDEHSLLITDVRFSPGMPHAATSSFDKTVKVWDADNPSYSLRTFTGHSTSVMSLDFHPNKDDLICSCDGDGEIRYWSISNGTCVRIFKGGTTQMRFQPHHGRYLAAAAENIVSIIDVETQTCLYQLKGHTKHVDSVCWDTTGEYVVSVSEDSVRVWSFGSGSEGECLHELSCNGNKFHSCVFHPTYSSLLIIGCYQSLELWDMSENKTMTLPAHEGLIAALASSTVNGLVASASHDKFVKLWK